MHFKEYHDIRESQGRPSPNVSNAMYWFHTIVKSIPTERVWGKIHDPKLQVNLKHMFGLSPEEVEEFINLATHHYHKRITHGMMQKALHHGDYKPKHNPMDVESY